MKKLLVIDGNNIIHRAYYGVRPLSTKSGKPTNAVYGTISMVAKQLEQLKPDYAAVAFDLKAPTFRHKLYPEYKAGRHPTPEDLLAQFDDAKEVLAAMGLHLLTLEGYEADDIQGTVAHMAHRYPDVESFIFSGDRDLLQLIDEKITVLAATNSDTLVMHEAEFLAKYGVPASAFVDMKALMGDASDNIPGVGGVGEKTAAALISAFGSLDGVYESIDDPRIKKGVREKLLRDRETAYLSRTLSKIDTEAPLNLELEDLAYHGMDKAALYRKLTELELNSFIAKFHLQNADSDIKKKSDTSILKTIVDISSVPQELTEKERLVLLVEKDAFLISDGDKNYRLSGVPAVLSPLISSLRECITFDGKALLHRLTDAGCPLPSSLRLLDLSLYAYVLNPGSGSATLPSLLAMFLGIPEEEGTPAALFALEDAMRQKIRADGEERVLDELEIPLLPILAEMERTGFRIRPDGMREFADALSALAEDLTSRIYMQAGEVFNINSPKQLGEVLFEKMGLTCSKKKTKNGYSTDAETLEELRAYAPIVEDILEYRQVTKLRNTYAAVLPTLADENDRIHTEFKQTLTATGRLSSADPNLQNIPIRTKMGREMRRYFIAKEGYSLVDADYSQIELRLLAHISGDEKMCEAFRNGEDIHKKTASAVFGVPEDAVTDELRKRAKAVNFGIVYGIGGFSLAKDIGTSVKQASAYIQSYKYNYLDIDAYLDRAVKEAEACGYSVTPYGRRRYIPELSAQNASMRAFGRRVAMNAPIQGAAADIIKAAMIRVAARLKKEALDARLVMQVHDELILEVRDDEIPRAAAVLKEEMEHAVTLSVPLTVDVTVGKNWLEQTPI